MENLPTYIWILTAVGIVAMPLVTVAMIYRNAIRSTGPERQATAVTAGTATVLGGWLAAATALTAAHEFLPAPGQTIPTQVIAAVGSTILLLAATRLTPVARALSGPGAAARLIVPQTLRVVGAVFVLVWALGRLPALFALPAGLGDFTVGVSAPFVARAMAAGTGRRRAVWFNVLGLVDLAVAVTTGVLARSLDLAPSMRPLSLLPLALIPVWAVPVAAALHITSLQALRARTTRTARLKTAAAQNGR